MSKKYKELRAFLHAKLGIDFDVPYKSKQEAPLEAHAPTCDKWNAIHEARADDKFSQCTCGLENK
jgi:hypothetical protein